MSSLSRLRPRRSVQVAIAGTVAGLLAALGPVVPSAMGASPPPSVTVTGAGGSPYGNGAVVAISVGPNSFFAPNSRIEVIECAAPKGVDPVSDATCDGNTAQAGSVLVARDGSFAVPHYTLYSLPNTALEETADGIPVCNAGAQCVLYIGQNQNDFTAPKVFSAAFTVQPTAGSTPVAAHHPPVPGAPITGVSKTVAAAGASTIQPIPAATPTTAPASSRSSSSAPGGGSGSPASSAPATHPSPAVAGSAGGPTNGPLGLGSALWWLAILAVLLALVGVIGFRWRRSAK